LRKIFVVHEDTNRPLCATEALDARDVIGGGYVHNQEAKQVAEKTEGGEALIGLGCPAPSEKGRTGRRASAEQLSED
jgi:hypothetical protein